MALKPRDPNEDRAFTREVDEEVRREVLADTARRYGLAIGLGVLALLLAVGGYLWWQHDRAQAREAEAELYVRTLNDLDDDKPIDAAKRLAPLTTSDHPGPRAVAQLLLAARAIEATDTKAAAARYAAVAGDEAIAEPFRQLALLRQTTLEFERLPPAEVERRLAPLATPGSPWFGSAGELLAHARLKAGQTRQAGALLAQLAGDATVPTSIRSRATQLAGSIGVDAVQPDPAPGNAGAPATGPTP